MAGGCGVCQVVEEHRAKQPLLAHRIKETLKDKITENRLRKHNKDNFKNSDNATTHGAWGNKGGNKNTKHKTPPPPPPTAAVSAAMAGGKLAGSRDSISNSESSSTSSTSTRRGPLGKLVCGGVEVSSEVVYWREVPGDVVFESPITPHHGEHHDT